LYGAASNGGTSCAGASGYGVVYKIDTSGNEIVLYNFTGGNDGAYPSSPVVLDWGGNLYGTTSLGGAANLGVTFKLDPSGHETVLHTFTRGPYGNQPDQSGVILDEFGNLYGTTAFNGAGGQGAVYKLNPSGNATVLYAFPGPAGGQYPRASGVIFGSDGHLYGATNYGGRLGTASCTKRIWTAMRGCCTTSTSSPATVLANQTKVSFATRTATSTGLPS